MFQRPHLIAALLCVGAILAACESTPASYMPEAEFQNIVGHARAEPRPVLAENELSELLSNASLSDAQKGETYYARAYARWRGNYDKPGAITDFDRFAQLRPGDERVAETGSAKADIAGEIVLHEQRLQGLQTLENWFNDMVALGRIIEGAERFQRAGLTPNEAQLTLLRDAGYICTGVAGGQPVHQHGDVPAHAAELVWCPGTPKA